MNLCKVFGLVGLFVLNNPVFADSLNGKNEIPVEKVIQNKSGQPNTATVDDLLTNNRLRAISGSASRWSIASQVNYNGGSLLNPLSQDRPNISSASATTTKSAMVGSFSVKYSISPKDSLLTGVGMRWIAPLSGGNISNYKGTTFDLMNPYLTYQHVYKWSGIQSIFQVTGMQWTQADQSALGYSRVLSISQENLYAVGKTGLSLGIYGFLQYQFFNKSGSLGNPSEETYIPDLRAVQSQYAFGISPYLEYQISKVFNLRTVLNFLSYEHFANYSSPLELYHDTASQSVGLGITVNRDMFLYPNVQFLPGKMMASLTNVGLSASINFF